MESDGKVHEVTICVLRTGEAWEVNDVENLGDFSNFTLCSLKSVIWTLHEKSVGLCTMCGHSESVQIIYRGADKLDQS